MHTSHVFNYSVFSYVINNLQIDLVPTLVFGTIRRHIWLLNIFSYEKIDSRLIDAQRPLISLTLHRTTAIHGAVRIRTEMAAADVAIPFDSALKIGVIIALHFFRANVAASV